MVAYSLPSIGQTNEALIHGAEGISTVISKDGGQLGDLRGGLGVVWSRTGY